MEVVALVMVRKVLELEDLEFTILLNKSEDADTVVFELVAIRGCTKARPLCRGRVL